MQKIDKACNEIVYSKVKNGYVRPVAWRGSEMMAISAKNKIHFADSLMGVGLILIQKLKRMVSN